MKDGIYELFPIGKLIRDKQITVVRVIPGYRPALKYLELFSHASIFLKKRKECTPVDRPDGLKNIGGEIHTKDFLSGKGELYSIVAEILNVNEKEGIVELDYNLRQDEAAVFDIKAYFPCEDRVKISKTPDFMKNWSEWWPDEIKSAAVNVQTNFFMDSEIEERCSIDRLGFVRKRDGKCLIELEATDESFFNYMEGFSHVKILWWFDRFDKSNYRKITQCNPPYEKAPRTGVFASRSPVRPNPIAMSVSKILHLDIQNRFMEISGLDAFDNTSVIGLVPYIPLFDRVKEYRVPEWLEHWPEWLDDRGPEVNIERIEVGESDISRIKKYMTEEERDTKALIGFVEEETSNDEYRPNEIIIKGARQNNLKNISFTIPKNKMTVITGVSGSGKSSLAFDTIYAESQRRFMNSVAASNRVNFELMEKPDFDQITGLPPAVAMEQKNAGRNPRSTVGTMTDIYDYLKLLFSRIGVRHCPECGRAITPLKTDEIVDVLMKLSHGTVLNVHPFKSERVLGEFVSPGRESEEKDSYRKELKKCIEKALIAGNGAILVIVNRTDEFMFQTKEICYYCDRIFFELTTSTFSFNNPESMCPVCKGLGVKLEVDSGLIVSNPDLSVLDGASKWWGDLRKFRQKPNANWMKGEVLALAESLKVDLEMPWKELPEDFRRQAIYGSGDRKVKFIYKNTNGRKGEIVRPVEGAFNTISRLFRENNGNTASRISDEFMTEKICSGCKGERLTPEGRFVSIAKTRFPETVVMTIEELKKWVNDLPQRLSEELLKISTAILKELNNRLKNLIEVGVPYLTLDRSIPSLSGGELQRLRLAAQLGSGITNILYILDEPSAGLHPRDQNKLIKILKNIRDNGNTVLIVEHDTDTMLAADKIIDVGPGAGIHGGYIDSEGSPEEIMKSHDSETGKYLAGIKHVTMVGKGERKKPCGWIKIKEISCNNLKNIDAKFPLGVFTCVTGVSGSGKSSLILETLFPVLSGFLNNSDGNHVDYEGVEGLENADKVIGISQRPIGRTPRSNPATYTGVFDHIRNLFAATEEAKKRGYGKNRFSFNSKEGQCEVCGGEGRRRVEMHFMPDVWVKCPICHGKRFNADTLEIKYNDKCIADVLNMNIEEALYFFRDDKKISIILQTLYDVGLGYVKLGQSALTLSGGEAQRIKLAKELSKPDTGRTIYLLDEPTTGLHFSDVQNLLNILHQIKLAGNTVIVIE
ncbi:MAG: excinuclease subunit, partial [Kosmotogales bacterium]|nr:excinuclease subunit [Kosmotogales bacterium]